uniref:Uncharacterized protein n=1 Tax=Lepeophtheirus salmonis TaxID=72036 RepID=A0A0K2TN96_LEPSM
MAPRVLLLIHVLLFSLISLTECKVDTDLISAIPGVSDFFVFPSMRMSSFLSVLTSPDSRVQRMLPTPSALIRPKKDIWRGHLPGGNVNRPVFTTPFPSLNNKIQKKKPVRSEMKFEPISIEYKLSLERSKDYQNWLKLKNKFLEEQSKKKMENSVTNNENNNNNVFIVLPEERNSQTFPHFPLSNPNPSLSKTTSNIPTVTPNPTKFLHNLPKGYELVKINDLTSNHEVIPWKKAKEILQVSSTPLPPAIPPYKIWKRNPPISPDLPSLPISMHFPASSTTASSVKGPIINSIPPKVIHFGSDFTRLESKGNPVPIGVNSLTEGLPPVPRHTTPSRIIITPKGSTPHHPSTRSTPKPIQFTSIRPPPTTTFRHPTTTTFRPPTTPRSTTTTTRTSSPKRSSARSTSVIKPLTFTTTNYKPSTTPTTQIPLSLSSSMLASSLPKINKIYSNDYPSKRHVFRSQQHSGRPIMMERAELNHIQYPDIKSLEHVSSSILLNDAIQKQYYTSPSPVYKHMIINVPTRVPTRPTLIHIPTKPSSRVVHIVTRVPSKFLDTIGHIPETGHTSYKHNIRQPITYGASPSASPDYVKSLNVQSYKYPNYHLPPPIPSRPHHHPLLPHHPLPPHPPRPSSYPLHRYDRKILVGNHTKRIYITPDKDDKIHIELPPNISLADFLQRIHFKIPSEDESKKVFSAPTKFLAPLAETIKQTTTIHITKKPVSSTVVTASTITLTPFTTLNPQAIVFTTEKLIDPSIKISTYDNPSNNNIIIYSEHKKILQNLADTIKDINVSIESLNSSLISSRTTTASTTIFSSPTANPFLLTTTTSSLFTLSTTTTDSIIKSSTESIQTMSDTPLMISIRRDVASLVSTVSELKDQRKNDAESIPKQVEKRLKNTFEDMSIMMKNINETLMRTILSSRSDTPSEEDEVNIQILQTELERLGGMIGELRLQTSQVPVEVISTLFKAKDQVRAAATASEQIKETSPFTTQNWFTSTPATTPNPFTTTITTSTSNNVFRTFKVGAKLNPEPISSSFRGGASSTITVTGDGVNSGGIIIGSAEPVEFIGNRSPQKLVEESTQNPQIEAEKIFLLQQRRLLIEEKNKLDEERRQLAVEKERQTYAFLPPTSTLRAPYPPLISSEPLFPFNDDSSPVRYQISSSKKAISQAPYSPVKYKNSQRRLKDDYDEVVYTDDNDWSSSDWQPSYKSSYIINPTKEVNENHGSKSFKRPSDDFKFYDTKTNSYIIQGHGLLESSDEVSFNSSPLEVILYPDSAKELLNSSAGKTKSYVIDPLLNEKGSATIGKEVVESPKGIIPLILRSAKDDLKLIGNAIQYALER